MSKAIVAEAQRTGRAIALEDLGGIRGRVTARRPQRARMANWAFAQLRGFISYKARLVGIEVIAVDPRNTSRTCPKCGCVDKANRRTQAEFALHIVRVLWPSRYCRGDQHPATGVGRQGCRQPADGRRCCSTRFSLLVASCRL